MVTIEDIAKQAGVSHSTVSRALAGSTLVNAVTRERVLRISGELGYQVNFVARSLVTRSTKTLGLVVPQVSNPYFPKLIQHIADLVRQSGYSLQLHLSGIHQEDEALCLEALRGRQADGVILVTAERGLVAGEEARRLSQSGVPLVLMGWVPNAEDLDIVMADDVVGGYQIACHLLSLGHRRFAVLGSGEHRGSRDRVRGFQSAVEEADPAGDCVLCMNVCSEADLQSCLDQLLHRPALPTAVFAYHDALAVQVLKYLGDIGIPVPERMAVVGFDNLDLAAYVTPHLTTVDHQLEAQCEQAVGLLLKRLRGDCADLPPQHIVVTPHVIVRQSCGVTP